MIGVVTRTARKAAGAEAPATLPKEAVAKAIAQIASGLTDPYLRALYDAVVDRRHTLEADGGVPEQFKINPAEVKYEIDHDMQDVPRMVNVTVGSPQPAFIDQTPPAPVPVRRGRKPKASGLGHVAARPSLSQTTMPTVMPLPRQQWIGLDVTTYFHHNGLAYLKTDFRGHQVVGLTSEGVTITFEISGVGDKTIKCLIVTEPPRGATSGKTNLWEKWNANEPVFMPHSLIAPWLAVPTDITSYV